MKYFILVLFSSLIIAGCSSSKMVSMDPVTYDPCTEQANLTSKDVFTGETVNNVAIDQQGSVVFLTMDVRTYCNSQLTSEMKQSESQVTLMLSNSNTATDDCVCIKKARTSFRDMAPGTYTLKITDKTGYKLLDQKTITIPE